MSAGYVGEIRMFAGTFAPAGWMTCDGQLLDISENDTLFNLISTTYGGDGQNTFALPNLAGAAPLHMGQARSTTTYTIGQSGGTSGVTLTTAQLPSHSHSIVADGNIATTNQTTPSGSTFGTSAATNVYSTTTTGLHPMMTLQSMGGSQPHDNMQPFLAVTYIISLFGIYPSAT